MKRPLLIIAICLLTFSCLVIGYWSWRGSPVDGSRPPQSPLPIDIVDQDLVVRASLSTTVLKPGVTLRVRLTLENTGAASRTVRPSSLSNARLTFFDSGHMSIRPTLGGPYTPNRQAMRQSVTLLPGETYSRTLTILVGSNTEWPGTPMPEDGFWALFRNMRWPLAPGVHYMYIEVPIAPRRVARTETFALEFDAAGGRLPKRDETP